MSQQRGEYTVSHLRPIPSKMEEFMPLWDARKGGLDARTVAEIRANIMSVVKPAPQSQPQ